jgi:hypothetical protein
LKLTPDDGLKPDLNCISLEARADPHARRLLYIRYRMYNKFAVGARIVQRDHLRRPFFSLAHAGAPSAALCGFRAQLTGASSGARP